MNDHRSSHSPIVIGLLCIILVLQTIGLGYVTMLYSGVQVRQEENLTNADTPKRQNPPFVYVKDRKDVYVVNRVTGEETLIHHEESPKVLSVLAVPQVGYAGKIYLSSSCTECDSPVFEVLELDLSQEGSTPVKLDDATFERGSLRVSPDQTKLAYVVFEPQESIWSTGDQIMVWDLVTGEHLELAKESEWYFFSTFHINEMFGSLAEGFSLEWQNRSCVQAGIHERPQTDIPLGSGKNTFVRYQEYCLE